MKSVLWRVAKRLSYIEDARCLKVKINNIFFSHNNTNRGQVKKEKRKTCFKSMSFIDCLGKSLLPAGDPRPIALQCITVILNGPCYLLYLLGTVGL